LNFRFSTKEIIFNEDDIMFDEDGLQPKVISVYYMNTFIRHSRQTRTHNNSRNKNKYQKESKNNTINILFIYLLYT